MGGRGSKKAQIGQQWWAKTSFKDGEPFQDSNFSQIAEATSSDMGKRYPVRVFFQPT